MKSIIKVLAIVSIWASLQGQTPEEAIKFLENSNGIGARAQAMGGAVTATASGYAAIYFNPACLTLLRKSEITGSMYSKQQKNIAVFKDNQVMNKDRFNQFQSFGLAYSFPTARGSLVLAWGYNRFKDLDDFTYFTGFNSQKNGLGFDLKDTDGKEYYFPYDSEVKQTEDIREYGHLGAWSFGGGLALSPNFSAGITLSLIKGYSEYDFRFYQDDVKDLYKQFPANYDSYELYNFIRSEFSGFQTTIGGLFKLNKNLNMGVSVKLPSVMHVDENYSSNDVIYFDDKTSSKKDLGNNDWEYLIRYPAQVSAGMALDTKLFLLSASCDYRDWTETKFDIPAGLERNDDYNDLLLDNKKFRDNFRPVLTYNFGGELRIPKTGLKLRGGYKVVPSPLYKADESLDKKYITAGLGYDLDERTTLDVACVSGKWDRFSNDSLTPGGVTESLKSKKIIAGITYRF